MNDDSNRIRVMWLLNHRTARHYDLAMLSALELNEIFLPKSFPYDEGNLSGDVDYSMDGSLSIPADALSLLNGADWYNQSDDAVWEVANRYFQIAICPAIPDQLDKVTRHFQGIIILRCFGLSAGLTYSKILYDNLGFGGVDRIRGLADRFWFGQAYQHLHEIEHEFLRNRRCDLPLGLPNATLNDRWEGGESRILLVCPRIGTSAYYKRAYQEFLRDFKGLPYAILGAQPIAVPDSNVLGFVDQTMYENYMTRFRLMYYPSSEAYHIHYHPFEAVRAGMPLIFMAGGLLDKLGGKNLPGRCNTVKEARRKIERLLSGDVHLAERIREGQSQLLVHMRPEHGVPIWRASFAGVLATSKKKIIAEKTRWRPRPKIAVILPLEYRGGTLRAIKMIATALHVGSRQAGEPADIVLAHLNNPERYPDAEFDDLPAEISRRPYRWETLSWQAAERVCRYQGHEISLDETQFGVPDDGINHFLDCDLWLVISDRLNVPLLPLKPYALIVFDYIQRYQPVMEDCADIQSLRAARAASAVMVTTRFTRDDATQYAGVDPSIIHLVPHIVPLFAEQAPVAGTPDGYFLWPTNMSIHKNHLNSLQALRFYYEEFGGSLRCWITGVDSHSLFGERHPNRERENALFNSSRMLQSNLVVKGDLPDPIYQKCLAGARFLWHSALVDNGTFAAIEATSFGVPTLSSRYPAMQEMNDFYDLKVAWCDPYAPRQMAMQLKLMEDEADRLRLQLPSRASLEARGVEYAAPAYWQVVRRCL